MNSHGYLLCHISLCLSSEAESDEDQHSDVSEEHQTQQLDNQTNKDSHQPLEAG